MSPIRQSDATAARLANASTARAKYLLARQSAAHDDYKRGQEDGDTPRALTTKEDNDYRITRDCFVEVMEGPSAAMDIDDDVDFDKLAVEPSRRDRLADSFATYLATGNRNVLTDTIYETSVDSGKGLDEGRGGWQEAPLDQDLYRRAADAVELDRNQSYFPWFGGPAKRADPDEPRPPSDADAHGGCVPSPYAYGDDDGSDAGDAQGCVAPFI